MKFQFMRIIGQTTDICKKPSMNLIRLYNAEASKPQGKY